MIYKADFKLNAYFIFRFHLPLQLFAIASIVFFISLGNWQLQRANLKKQMQLDYINSINSNSKPINLNQNLNKINQFKNYQLIEVEGKYDFFKQILRDHRTYQGKRGYFVFTPFLIEGSNKAILVNRGFIEIGINRNSYKMKIKPNSIKSQVKQKIIGKIYRSLDRFQIGEYPLGNWPVVVQNLDYQAISKVLKVKVLATTLRLLSSQNYGYIRDWSFQTTTSKEKHQGYAIQWFSFALIAFFILIFKSFKFLKSKD